MTHWSTTKYSNEVGSILKWTSMWALAVSMTACFEKAQMSFEQPGSKTATDTSQTAPDLRPAACAVGSTSPGRVTARRLSRLEYSNTLRDLFQDDVALTTSLPDDNLGYGFDNNADVLSVSPLLLEKYMAAADELLANYLTQPAAIAVINERQQAETMTHEVGGLSGQYWNVWSNGQISFARDIVTPGTYEIRVRAKGQLAGTDLPRMEVVVNNSVVRAFDVSATDATYTVQKTISAGGAQVAVGFTNDYTDSGSDRNLLVDWIEIQGPLNAVQAPTPTAYTRLFSCHPGGGVTDTDCARAILSSFTERAYRRALASDEVDPLLSIYSLVRSKGGDFDEGIRQAVKAVLVSPKFLFRTEGDASVGGIQKLNDWELASRLSYFIWASMPDAVLFALAERGKLSEPDTLRTQVKRMLADARSSALVKGFAAQWLETRALQAVMPDHAQFPAFDDDLRVAMQGETEQLLTYIIQNDHDIFEVIDADYTFLNGRLSAHYGIGNVSGPGFQKVSLVGTSRRGILSHASMLTVTSNPTRTSPVKRGKWVLSKLLCQPPPPPPPGVETIGQAGGAVDPTLPIRDQMARHRTNATCVACHATMDPIGFGLDNFNPVGALRTQDEHGNPVDDLGTLPDGQSFRGAQGLIQVLEANDAYTRCLSQNLIIYAMGRGLNDADQCTVNSIAANVRATHDRRFASIVEQIVTSAPFVSRQSE